MNDQKNKAKMIAVKCIEVLDEILSIYGRTPEWVEWMLECAVLTCNPEIDVLKINNFYNKIKRKQQ